MRRDHQALTWGRARATFYSAQPSAHVVGATASLLLEVDEAQDVDKEKFQREFLPMAAAHNAVVVLYGTAWTDDTLLEQERQHNLAAQRAGGEQRHFEYPWTFGAAVMPAYRQFVEHEIERLGAQHPLIRTQYLLQTVADRSALFSPEQRLLLQGTHARQTAPDDGGGIRRCDRCRRRRYRGRWPGSGAARQHGGRYRRRHPHRRRGAATAGRGLLVDQPTTPRAVCAAGAPVG